MTGSDAVGPVRLADGLGIASSVLGAPMLLAPRRLLRIIGIRDDGRPRAVLAMVGVREFAAAVTILGMRHRRVGAWSRVAGDTLDLTLLGLACRSRREDARRLGAAIAFVTAILAADLFTALRLNRAEGVGVPDGSTSHGVGAELDRDDRPSRIRTAVTILASEEQVRAAFREFPWSGFDAGALEDSGQAWFAAAPGGRGTELHLDHELAVPGGAIGGAARKLVGKAPDQTIEDDLRRFKSVVETGVEARSEKTPEGFSTPRLLLQRPGQPSPAVPAGGGSQEGEA